MHIGVGFIFQGLAGPRHDAQVYADEYLLADRAEALGFDSLWQPEHHFTGYIMTPDPLMFLSYFAARTKHIRLGTMVNVLPWHDVVRLTENISVMDHISNGRYILGVGRGVAKTEFDGFRRDMNTSRQVLLEAAAAISQGLEHGYIEYDGEVIKQPRVDIRPKPKYSFQGRMYASAVSSATFPILAKLGFGLLLIPGNAPWEQVAKDLENYRGIYRELHGREAPKTIFAGWTFADRDAARAEEMGRKYLGEYIMSAVQHYDFAGEHMKGLKGYEHYAAVGEATKGVDSSVFANAFIGNHIMGTPEQCFEKIRYTKELLGSAGCILVPKYASMPMTEATRNLEVIASDLLPRVKAFEPGLDIGEAIPHAQAAE